MRGPELAAMLRRRSVELAGGAKERRKTRIALSREIEALLPTLRNDAADIGEILAAIRKVKEASDKLFGLYAVRAQVNSGGDMRCREK